MYEYTDKVIGYLNKQFINMFRKAKALSSFDELNVLQYSKTMYAQLEAVSEKALLRLAKYYYKKHSKSNKTDITLLWLLAFLREYNPVTKYVYLHEIERKQARFAESLIAGADKSKEIDAALRLWSKMINQYAVEITDAAVLQGYADGGIRKVVWVTALDERRCSMCREREGAVYDIDKIPPKPHLGCRCYIEPWR